MHGDGTLPRRVRIGYGSGSVATGAFGTVPGLMLLPYLTDSLGDRLARGGADRVPPQGLGRDPQPDRRPDQRPHRRPARPAAPVAAEGRHRPGGRVRADLRRSRHRFAGDRGGVGPRLLPGRGDGVRVLPGAVRRDAGRDHLVVRRAHPADDLAGGAARADDHDRGCQRAPDPRPRRRPRRLSGDGRGDGGPDPGRRGERLPRHPHGSRRRRRAGPGQPARPAAHRGHLPRLPGPVDDVRHPGAGHRQHARRCRLPGPAGARRHRCEHHPVRLLRRARRWC